MAVDGKERNVAFYIRVSTDRQAQIEEGSLKNQEQMLHAELARRNDQSPNWGKHIKSYVDEGLSGKDTNRPAFRQMMQDIELGNVQAVMFTELSRLSRSLKDFLNIFEFAQKYRCDLVCLKTEIDTTSPYKSLITKILMIFAEFEREMTSRRTALNAYERSKRGLANGGVAPLGYKRMKQKKGHLFIDEKEKQIVQDIFVTYIRLQSIRKTTDHIKEKYDTKNPRLKNMSSTKVYAILTNKTYTGIRVINTNDKENREEVPAVWEPIIDRETFEKVQTLLQKNREKFHSRGNQRYLYYFSGLLRCGKCGEKLQGKSAYSTNKIRHYYYSHTSTCPKEGINRIDAELVHSLIFNWLEDLVTDGIYYKQLQMDGKQRINEEFTCVQEELNRLENEKTAIAEQIETRIAELVKTDSDIVRASIEQSIEKLEAGRLEIDEKVTYINRYLLELESIRKNGTDLYKGLKSKIRDVLKLVENQPENADKQARERSKAEMRRLFAFLQLHETQIKTALSGVHLKEPVSKVFAPSPPTKQYTNKKFYLIQDTIPLPGRLLVQSKQHIKSLVKQHLSSREIGRELDISHQAVLSAIEKLGLNGSNGSDRHKPGQIPFGWEYVDYQLKKNKEEQDVIRIIKQLKSSGFSLRGISSELNKQLVPTKNNGIWHANTVKKILERAHA